MKIRWIVALALFALVSPARAEPVDKRFEHTFDVSEGTKLLLEHGDGNVTLIPWDKDQIDVEVIYRADEHRWGIGDNREFAVEFDQRGDVVHVRERKRSGLRIGVHTTVDRRYEYTIQAPAYVELEFRGDDGDVEVEGWRASAEFDLDDGDLRIDGLEGASLNIQVEDGDVRLRDVTADLVFEGDDSDVLVETCRFGIADFELQDGDVTVRESEGSFNLKLDDGDLELDDVIAPRLRVRAQDGRVSITARETESLDWDVRTDDGDIHVVLADGTSVAFSIDADDGDIDLDVPGAEDLEKRRNHASGLLHGGAGDLRIRTQDGEVRLRQRG